MSPTRPKIVLMYRLSAPVSESQTSSRFFAQLKSFKLIFSSKKLIGKLCCLGKPIEGGLPKTHRRESPKIPPFFPFFAPVFANFPYNSSYTILLKKRAKNGRMGENGRIEDYLGVL